MSKQYKFLIVASTFYPKKTNVLLNGEITELQKDLAATFRWTARLNMHEAVANHFSACVPESSNFYVNKAGIHFSRMRASDLILVTKENKEELKNSPHIVDPTAINIHGAIHEKVPHARCIFHAHPKYATALSALKAPTLKPIDQNTMSFYNTVSPRGWPHRKRRT